MLQALLHLLQTVEQIASSSADHRKKCKVVFEVVGAIQIVARSDVTRNLASI